MKLLKIKLPLNAVEMICAIAVLIGIFALVAESWATGLCLLLGPIFSRRISTAVLFAGKSWI